MKALGEICEFKYGKGLPEHSRSPGGVPVYGSNGIVGYHQFGITEGTTIVIGRKGSIGEINISAHSCWPIDTTYYVDQSCTAQDIRWLAYALKDLRLADLNKATGVPGLNRNDAYEQKIYVPPLAEQKRIAAILDQADELQRKRRETLDKLEDLREAVFFETFVRDKQEDWQVVHIADIACDIRTGPFGSQLLHSEFVDEGIAVLGIDNAVNNEFRWRPHHGEQRRVRIGTAPSDAW
jgi:type I restriction enzyme, S subunit